MNIQQYNERNAKGFEGDHLLEAQVKKYIADHRITLVVELGSYRGATTNKLTEMCQNVISCEINPDNFAVAKQSSPNALIFNCSSVQFLETNLKNMANQRLLLFVDSHSWNTPTPIYEEFKLIKESGVKPFLIIHDVKVPDKDFGFDSYGGVDYELSAFEKYLDEIYTDGYYIDYNSEAEGARRGAMFVTPKITEVSSGKKENLEKRLKKEIKKKFGEPKKRKPMSRETKDKISAARKNDSNTSEASN